MKVKEIHIKAEPQNSIAPCTENFRIGLPKGGSGTLVLNQFGEYTLTTRGISEGSIKRTSEYRNALNKVSRKMLSAYNSLNENYTAIHKKMEKIHPLSLHQKELESLTPDKYKRKSFGLAKPTKNEVEEDLRNEAKSVYYEKIGLGENQDENEYITSRLNSLTEQRQAMWQEAYDLFNKIEDAREEKTNNQYIAEYKTIYDQEKDYIEGKESIVKENIHNVLLSLVLPYDITINCEYSQQKQQITAKIIFDAGINVPMSKADILSTGKISIKNKPVREMLADKSVSTMSHAYYMASKLYTVSPHVQYVQITMFDKSEQYPLLWIEFDRDKFAKLSPENLNVIVDIYSYPHVFNLKIRNGVANLETMTAENFQKEIEQTIRAANASHPLGKDYRESADGKLHISFERANELRNVPSISPEISKAIALSKDNGWDDVVIDKKYKSIIDETKTM